MFYFVQTYNETFVHVSRELYELVQKEEVYLKAKLGKKLLLVNNRAVARDEGGTLFWDIHFENISGNGLAEFNVVQQKIQKGYKEGLPTFMPYQGLEDIYNPSVQVQLSMSEDLYKRLEEYANEVGMDVESATTHLLKCVSASADWDGSPIVGFVSLYLIEQPEDESKRVINPLKA